MKWLVLRVVSAVVGLVLATLANAPLTASVDRDSTPIRAGPIGLTGSSDITALASGGPVSSVFNHPSPQSSRLFALRCGAPDSGMFCGVPPAADVLLGSIGRLASVQGTGPAWRPDEVHSEALSAMGALDWHSAGYLGQGVKVGVIDLGFSRYTLLLGSELPSQVSTRNLVDGQEGTNVGTGTAAGTAVAEIIHDVAPGAELYLAKILTPADLVEAVDWLLGNNVQVIVTAFSWYDVGPGDGTGAVAQQVQRARSAGALWVSAAGDARQRHWCGDWVDPENGQPLYFTPDYAINWIAVSGEYELPLGTRIEAYLRWSDWNQVDQDIDLYLYEVLLDGSTPRVVASSQNLQTGLNGQAPTESLAYVTGSDRASYGVAIKAYDVTRSVHLDLFLAGDGRLLLSTPAQSLSNLADAADVLSVGSVSSAPPFPLLADSSAGPTKGPGGVAEGGSRQPSLVAYSGVSTASDGLFPGSAAAAAHAAGAAALLLGRSPAWTDEDVQQYLLGHARDDYPPVGWDLWSGYGRLVLGPAQALSRNVWLPLVVR